MKKALITGITGQDGSYLAELLLEKGYAVHGIVGDLSTSNFGRIEHLKSQLQLHEGDLSDSGGLKRIIEKVNPDEVYNLAAMSHVKVSFEMPEYTADVDAIGVLRLLDAIRLTILTFGFIKPRPQNFLEKCKKSLKQKKPLFILDSLWCG